LTWLKNSFGLAMALVLPLTKEMYVPSA